MGTARRNRLSTIAATVAATGLIATGAFITLEGHSSSTSAVSPPHSSASSTSSSSAAAKAAAHQDAALNKAANATQKPAPSLTQFAAGTHDKLRLNPDDATGADQGAAYSGSPSATYMPATVASGNAAQHTSNTRVAVNPSLRPDRLLIPSIGVNASIIPERYTTASGVTYLNIPQQSWRVAWDAHTAPLDATSGNTVIAGHIDFNGIPHVFYQLHDVKVGTIIYVSDQHGKIHTLRVVTRELFSKSGLPESVYYPLAPRVFTFLTCGGGEGYVSGPTGGYIGHLDNFVVQAVPVS